MSTEEREGVVPGARVARVGLVVTAVAIVAAWVFGALDFLEVGVSGPPPRSPEAGQRAIDAFFVHEEAYLQWGRWIDVATAVAFVGLLLVIPSLRYGRRASGALIGGVTVAVVADAIDLSKVIAFDTGRFMLDNGLPADFAAANMARHMLDGTSAYVWVTGLLLVAVGLGIVAAEEQPGRWRTVTGVLCASLVAVAVTDVSPRLRAAFVPAFTVMTGSLVAWTIAARAHLMDGRQSARPS